MITFNNYKQHNFITELNLTIPSKSVVFLSKHFSILRPSENGNILFENFPIHCATKTFERNIFTELQIGELFQFSLSIKENMMIISEIFQSSLIWSLPLKYFEIPKSLWNVKASKIENEIITVCEISSLLFCRQKVIQVSNIPKVSEKYQNSIRNVITSKVSHGNSIVFYSGKNLNIENQITLSL